MSGIYMASKTAHAPRWRHLRARGLPIISTWIDEAGKGETKCFTDLWCRCVSEAAAADCVIVYREEGEVLKGAFVEVGAALAVGRPVFAVGCDDISFVHHSGVLSCRDLNDAIREAAEMLLHGLVGHYAKAVSRGRLPQWAGAAHAIIDLLAEPFADQHRSPAVLNRVGGGGESGGEDG